MKDMYAEKIKCITESKFRDLMVIFARRRTPDMSVSRKELMYRLSMSDRDVWQLITVARKNRFPIIVNNHGGGYYLTNKIDEIQDFRRRQIKSRINDLEATDEAMIKAIEFIKEYTPDQVTIEEVLTYGIEKNVE